MTEKNKLIYNYNEHGLYYEKNYNNEKIVTFTIDTIQMEFDYTTGRLLSVIGFLSFIKTANEKIDQIL